MKIYQSQLPTGKPASPAPEAVKIEVGTSEKTFSVRCHRCERVADVQNGPVESLLEADKAGWRIFRTVKGAGQVCPDCVEACQLDAERDGLRYALYRFSVVPLNVGGAA